MAVFFRSVFVAILFSLSLGACTLIPGGNIQGAAGDGFLHASGDGELERDLKQINIIPVNASVVRELRSKQQLITQLVEDNRHYPKQAQNYRYHLGQGDVLSISIVEHPELGSPEAKRHIDNDGYLFFPYVGRFKVAGLTVAQLREQLTERLAETIKDPQVEIRVVAFRSQQVYITGEVVTPGVYPITDVPMTVLAALTSAHGLTPDADWQQASLTRNGERIDIPLERFYSEGDLGGNLRLQDGDVLHIRRNDELRVFIMGEVVHPKPVVISRSGLSLTEALNLAGGIDERRADAKGIFVLRPQSVDAAKRADVYQLDMSNALSLVLASEFELEPRDIVYVTSAPLARWNKVISLLLPSVITVENTP